MPPACTVNLDFGLGRTSICCATLRAPLRPRRSSHALLSSTGRAAQAVRNKRHHHRNPPEPPRGCPDTPEDNHVTRVTRRSPTTHFSSKFMSEHGDGYPENHHRVRDAAFAENTAVMRGLAEDLHAKVFEVKQGERPATAMSHAASYCRAIQCGPCSIPALA
jgi:hypothetical protein